MLGWTGDRVALFFQSNEMFLFCDFYFNEKHVKTSKFIRNFIEEKRDFLFLFIQTHPKDVRYPTHTKFFLNHQYILTKQHVRMYVLIWVGKLSESSWSVVGNHNGRMS